MDRWDNQQEVIEPMREFFDQKQSSHFDDDQDKTFPYDEIDKDDGTGKLGADRGFSSIGNHRDSMPDRPQSLALDEGTPTGNNLAAQ